MKRALIIFAILAMALPAFGADVVIPVTKSLDDPTPRTSVFPAGMQPKFLHYVIEQNGVLLSATCPAGCTELTVTGLVDGTYTYRMGAAVEVTRSDGSKAESIGWSSPKSVTIECGVPVPSAPELGTASIVCKE